MEDKYILEYLKDNYERISDSRDLIEEISEENIERFLGKEENHDKIIILQRDPDDDEYVSMLAVLTQDNELVKLYVDNSRVTENKLDMIIHEFEEIDYDELEIIENKEK